MGNMLFVNPRRRILGRRKQSYLLNPHNPMEMIHYPARKKKLWRSPISGVFGGPARKRLEILGMRETEKELMKISKRKHPFLKVAKKITHKKRRAHKKLHKAVKRHVIVKAVKKHLERKATPKRSRPSPIKAVVKAIRKSHRRTKTMAKRKSHRRARRHSNPFSLKGMTKSLVSTELLIDGSLVAGGMVASKFVMDFAASKMAFLASPIGKIAGRVVLGSLVIFGKKYIGGDRYAKPLAIGFIAPAVLDLVTMVVPAGLLPAGGVTMQAGYLPDVARSQVSLEQGYMPDVQEGSFGFSE